MPRTVTIFLHIFSCFSSFETLNMHLSSNASIARFPFADHGPSYTKSVLIFQSSSQVANNGAHSDIAVFSCRYQSSVKARGYNIYANTSLLIFDKCFSTTTNESPAPRLTISFTSIVLISLDSFGWLSRRFVLAHHFKSVYWRRVKSL